jgi:hypothetical protein
VEVLKRENKLFDNGMLFLREFILIPVTPDNEKVVDPTSIISVSDRSRAGSNLSNGSHHSDGGGEGGATGGADGAAAKKDNALDFLNKYDSNIAKLKSDVAKMKTNAE